MHALRLFFIKHKRRLARLVAVAGMFAVAAAILPQVPRSLNVELVLGQQHEDIVEVRLSYERAGEELQGVSFAFPKGAPSSVHHSAQLAPGDIDVQVEAWRADGQRLAQVSRVHAPVEGTLRIRLPEAQAPQGHAR